MTTEHPQAAIDPRRVAATRAADEFLHDYQEAMRGTTVFNYTAYTIDWFQRHWPARPAVDVEAVARHLATWCALDDGALRPISNLLREHVTDAPQAVAVEVTAGDVAKAMSDTGAGFFSEGEEHALAQHLSAALRARAADLVACRVVRRPVEMLGEWESQPSGRGILLFHSTERDPAGAWDTWCMAAAQLGVRDYPYVTAFREVNPDNGELGPVVTRTTTPRPREWRAADVPEGAILLLYGPDKQWCFNASSSRQTVADVANECNVSHLLILPTTLPAGVPRA